MDVPQPVLNLIIFLNMQLYLKGQKETAADILYTLNKKDRKIRLMLETL